MASKYVDTTSIIQVIGSVFNNPQILDDDRYHIIEEDFAENFHKIVFGAIFKLYELGASGITIQAISEFLRARPKSDAIFRSNNGEEWLLRTSEAAELESFEYYYNKMKKFSLLRAYDNCGINVKPIYDPENLIDLKLRQAQQEWLDNTPIEEIAVLIDNLVESIKIKFVDNGKSEVSQAGDGVLDLIESLKQTPEIGLPLYGDLINTVTRGARLKKFYLRSAASGTGKAIPNDTIIPTPDGMRRVGDIRPGDYLFDHEGKPTKVIAIHPQPQKKQVWEVEFKDGRIAECCEDHLWEYQYESHRGYKYRVESVAQIVERVSKLNNGLRTSDDRGYRFKVRLNKAVEYPEKSYSVHPYVMGALLGDGSFRYDNTNKALSFSSNTDELPNRVASLLGDGYYANKNSSLNYSYTFKHIDNPTHNVWVEEVLKDYSELWQAKSEDKYIPSDYLCGSIEQRYSLLQGLMDTDGSIDKAKGRVTFTTVSPALRDDFITLCRGLGFITSVCVDKREQYTTGEYYNIHVQAPKAAKVRMFTLARKVEVAEKYRDNGKHEEFKTNNSIVDIRPTDRYADMTCFTVDNKEHLFLMNDFIVTHNTRSMIADACALACGQYYDLLRQEWVDSGCRESVLFITTEQELNEIQTMMLAFLSGVNEDKILYGRYENDEEERVRQAALILKESNLFIEEMPDFSLKDIEDAIKINIRERNVKYVFNPKRVMGQ